MGINASSPGDFRKAKGSDDLEIVNKTKADKVKGSSGKAEKRIRIVDFASGTKHDVAVKGNLIAAGDGTPKKLGWLEAKRYTWIKVKVDNNEYFAKVNIGSLSKRMNIMPEWLTSTDNEFRFINQEVKTSIDLLRSSIQKGFMSRLDRLSEQIWNPSFAKGGMKQLFQQFKELKNEILLKFAGNVGGDLDEKIAELNKQSHTFDENERVANRLAESVAKGKIPLQIDQTTSEHLRLNRNLSKPVGLQEFSLRSNEGQKEFLQVLDGKISAYEYNKTTPRGLSETDKNELENLKKDMSVFLMMIRNPRNCGYTQTPLVEGLARSSFYDELNKIVIRINNLNFQVHGRS